MSERGTALLTVLKELAEQGVQRKAVLIRHAAREFVPGRHDLQNPLTDAGRVAARSFGAALPAGLTVRGYASPAARCVETAELALAGYSGAGGRSTRVRPMEGLGVFYVLDQMKMYQRMRELGGLGNLLGAWFAGHVPPDIVMPAMTAARSLLHAMSARLREVNSDVAQVDVLVSHDMTLGLMRHALLGQTWEGVGPVQFLDGVVLYELDGQLQLRSPHGPVRTMQLDS